ncbi:hypothetical protein AB0K43_16405 [Kitasatospora sp. NPDC049258]|uniref:hypothetical protein n=1 Tax=Kitasatospora sp. NPDC049258 TaxID=3155394 RepID=UPI003428F7FA
MTVPPLVDTPAAPAAALLDSDRVELPLPPARAALGRLDRLGLRYGAVVRHGGSAAFLLAPGTAELVPALLRWLGWGEELGLGLRPVGAVRVPLPRGTEWNTPHPERRPRRPAVWLRPGAGGPALNLGSPDLLRLLDCLADACARDLMGLAPAP